MDSTQLFMKRKATLSNTIARSKNSIERKSWDLRTRKGLVERLQQSGEGKTSQTASGE